jgi:hypothetical protein
MYCPKVRVHRVTWKRLGQGEEGSVIGNVAAGEDLVSMLVNFLFRCDKIRLSSFGPFCIFVPI